jgi:hypothetical protein
VRQGKMGGKGTASGFCLYRLTDGRVPVDRWSRSASGRECSARLWRDGGHGLVANPMPQAPWSPIDTLGKHHPTGAAEPSAACCAAA